MIEMLQAIELILSPYVLLLMVVGVLIGAVAGAIPGLTGGIALAVFLPFTFGMDPLPALIFLMSVFTGSTWGGALTAILINAPGSPASAATQLDGYPMTQRGESSRAVGLSLGASVVGALIGALFLIIAIEPLGRFALALQAPERFLIAFLGIAIIAALGGKRPAKAVLAGLFGLLLGTIGITATGVLRGTFDQPLMIDGIQFIPALIGVFLIPEIFRLMNSDFITHSSVTPKHSFRQVFSGVGEALKHPLIIGRSSAIGVGVGTVPAAGATVATLLSYNISRLISRKSSAYGTGLPEGIVAAESANSSSEGGSTATTFALGIPGGSATAVLLGAMISVGWVPGPQLIAEEIDVIRGLLWGQAFQALLLLPIGIVLAYFASKIIFVPTTVLIPVISIAAIAGAYGMRQSMVDVVVLLVFGLIGTLMRRYDYPMIALILGLILAPLADSELIRVTQIYAGDYTAFFTRPISLAMIIIGAALLVLPPLGKRLFRNKGMARAYSRDRSDEEI